MIVFLNSNLHISASQESKILIKKGTCMKKILLNSTFMVVILFSMIATVNAQDEMGAMPEMGAPAELKAMAWMVGEWNVVADFRMEENSEWINSTATAVYKFSVDGCVLEMDYDSELMGMHFKGNLLETYDRLNKQYQSCWTDNMNGRISYYTGYRSGDSTILSGDEYFPDGTKYISRIITFNETDTSFEWHSETSNDGGKTFWLSGKAKYTKK